MNRVINIIRAAHAELKVRDLGASRHFYVDVLGFVLEEETADALYLRGLEERIHHSLVLRKAEAPSLHHLSFRVATVEDLEHLYSLFSARGLPTRWVAPGEERGQGRALRVQDAMGHPLEFYAEMDEAPRLLQRFDLYRGAHVMRMDHFNIFVPNCQAAYDWYVGDLGFRCSEFTATEEAEPRVWAAWLFRKPNVHDLAMMNGKGPRLHHLGFWVADAMSVLRACDVLAASGYHAAIERGPGRHGISNAFFLYLRDPDGHRIELFTGDYLTADPDLKPVRWSINDPRRQTFWGHAAPASWFEEATPVERIDGSGLMPLQAPLLLERPQHVT